MCIVAMHMSRASSHPSQREHRTSLRYEAERILLEAREQNAVWTEIASSVLPFRVPLVHEHYSEDESDE